MFAAILGSLVMGTLASKVGENIVGKRLGMSDKDRRLLGTVFGMAGGAYGGYAGSAGFGSSGIGATGASGSAGGMGGSSPKVGGDYGTAVEVFNQPTSYTSINPHSGFNEFTGGYNQMASMPAESYGMDSFRMNEYEQLSNMPAETYGMDGFRMNEYEQLASMPAESYGMDMYATPSAKPDNWFDMMEVPKPTYQGPSSGNVRAETFALDTPSRTIDIAPSGTPLEVMDVGAYQAPAEPLYGVDPTSPTSNYLSQPYQTGTQPSSNLSMESAFQTSGDEIRLIQANGDGTFTEIGAPSDLSTAQGVEEFINMDQIRADEMMGGPLDPFGTGPNITSANSRVPSNIGDNAGEVPFIVDTPPAVDINLDPSASQVVRGQKSAIDAQERFLRTGPRLEDLDVATLNTPTARLESLDNKVFSSDAATTYSPSQVRAQSQVSLDDPQGTAEGLASEANAVKEVKAQILKDAGDGKFDLSDIFDKIPDSVKQWAAETGISLLDMWIQQELFGQDYDDQIASAGGGGGGRTLTGTSPMVSPYSGGGGGGGGGKGLLFSMGGGGQKKGGGHIMALQ